MYSSASCFASSLVLQPLPLASSRSGVLKRDSASASSHGLPGRDMDWAVPWDSRRRWNAREARWEPWSSWKTRLKPPGGPSLPTACPSASAASFSVMRPDIDRPTTFLRDASIAAARRGRPSPVPMQAIHPYCGDRKALKGYNDLRTTHPEIAREWNKERNGDLKPTDVIANSNKRV